MPPNCWQLCPFSHARLGAGLALRFSGQNFFKTQHSIGDVVDNLMGPRGLGFRLKDAALMDNLAEGKALAKALIAKKANVNVSHCLSVQFLTPLHGAC